MSHHWTFLFQSCGKKNLPKTKKNKKTDHNRNYSWAASKVLLFILQWEMLICPSRKRKKNLTETCNGPQNSNLYLSMEYPSIWFTHPDGWEGGGVTCPQVRGVCLVRSQVQTIKGWPCCELSYEFKCWMEVELQFDIAHNSHKCKEWRFEKGGLRKCFCNTKHSR
jgi:hypothetical protein